MNNCDGGYGADEEEGCEGHGEYCDYVVDGYSTTCCVCAEFEEHQACADRLSDMIDNAYDHYKDQQLRGMK